MDATSSSAVPVPHEESPTFAADKGGFGTVAVEKGGYDEPLDGNGGKSLSEQQEQDGEGEFEDAVGVPSNENTLDARAVAIRAPISEDVGEDEGEEEEEEDADAEGSFVSEGSYDSAPERMAGSSIDASSPVGSVGSPVSILGTKQQDALMQLNEMNSGVSSLDTSLLDSPSEEQFKLLVAEIAEKKELSSDDQVVRAIVDALLPLVRVRLSKNGTQPLKEKDDTPKVLDESLGASRSMPVAKLTSEDDDEEVDADDQGGEDADDEQDEDGNENHAGDDESEEEVNESEEPEGSRVEPQLAVGLRVQGLEDDSSMSLRVRGLVDDFPVEPQPAGFEKAAEQDAPPSRDDSRVESTLPVEMGQEITASEDKAAIEGKTSEELNAEVGLVKDVTPMEASEPPLHEEQPEVTVRDSEHAAKEEAVPAAGIEIAGADLGDSGGARSAEAVDSLPSNEDAKVNEGMEGRETEPLITTDGATHLETDVLGQTEDTQELVAHVMQDAESVSPQIKPGFSTGAGEAEASEETSTDAKVVEVEAETKREEAPLLAETAPQKDLISMRAGNPQPGKKEEKEAGGWEEGEEEEEEDDEDVSMDNSRDLAAMVRSSDSGAHGTDTPSLGGAGLSLPMRPAGLGRSVPSLEPAPRASQHSRSNGAGASRSAVPLEDTQLNGDATDGNEETREKLQMIRVKFLRLAHRLGQSANNVVVAQVLYRLGLAEQLRGGRGTSRTGAFSFERASVIAEEQEAAGQEELDFTCTIMLLGKSGVGKSATINSIFDEEKSTTNAFSPATKRVQEITGTVHGIKLRVIDTPGLLPSFADQRHNEKIMSSVKRFIKKSPPDIVLYFDRLDMQSRDFGDLPLLRTITDTFGAAVWFNAIVVLTHASSAPPDGANGTPLSYEMFVAQRSHVVQQTIRQAAGDMRLMNPVSLVENHAACRTNRAGQRVLPNGQVWKPQLLLLCFASKILAEANSLLKLQDSSPGRPFGVRPRVPPLPFLLSSLLQSRAQLKLADEQMGEEDESDEDLDEESESDDEIEYDELPPFRRLTKDELAMLDDGQRKAYFEELDYREKLFQKQQWKEELRRRKEMRKRKAAASKEEPQPTDESFEEESARSAAVPVAMPDMALPLSFDSDNPIHRYRCLDTPTQWTIRPVLENHGWDHDSSFDGLNVEKMFVISKKHPASVSGQITKDKKEANLQVDCAASFKHGEGKVTLAGLDIQTIGKDLAYTLRSETRFSNFKRNKTTGGVSVTLLGDTVAAGMKIEDRLMIGKRLKLVMNGGAITGRGDVAYGGSLEATLRDKDYPIGRTLSTLGLSVMDWHGDLAIGGNLQSQFMLGKTMITARANLNNRGAGQISIRANSSEQMQMALIGLIPLLRALIGSRLVSFSQPV